MKRERSDCQRLKTLLQDAPSRGTGSLCHVSSFLSLKGGVRGKRPLLNSGRICRCAQGAIVWGKKECVRQGEDRPVDKWSTPDNSLRDTLNMLTTRRAERACAAPPPSRRKQTMLLQSITADPCHHEPRDGRADISMTMQHAKVGKGKLQPRVLYDDNR